MTITELVAVQEVFPDLYLDHSSNVLRGELSFTASFDGDALHMNSPADKKYPSFQGCYSIRVDFNERDFNGFYKVWEVGGKLKTVIEERQLASSLDAHVNRDGSCCVGIFLPIEVQNIPVVKFVREVVFSYFAWHAYWATFNVKAPWGEYSHENGIREKMTDTLQSIRQLGRNQRCYCGSGRKYKFCCLHQVEAAQRRGRRERDQNTGIHA